MLQLDMEIHKIKLDSHSHQWNTLKFLSCMTLCEACQTQACTTPDGLCAGPRPYLHTGRGLSLLHDGSA